jgi:L-lactate dehydrogenase
MTRKVGIIGVGHVGAAVAHQIIITGATDNLVLIDIDTKKVEADALDFEDAMANLPSHTNITVNDYAELADADVIISAVGNIGIQKIKLDRFAEVGFTSNAVKHVAGKIKASGFNGILIVISNPCDIQTMIYQQLTGLPQNHVMGTGTLLDSARMQRAVAACLDIDPRSVTGYNLGEHGNSQFTAWSTVRVLGQPIQALAEQRGLNLYDLDNEARIGGYHVMIGKHYTNYAIAAATTRLLNAVLSDAHTEMPVSNYRPEFDCYVSYPVIVGRNGVLTSTQLDLSADEQTKLAQSANFIKTRFTDIMQLPLEDETTTDQYTQSHLAELQQLDVANFVE